jgi:hypothetical protein
MSKIDYTRKLLTERSLQIFEGADQNEHTTFSLIKKMISKINKLSEKKKFLVIFNPEIVISLVEDFNVSPDAISFLADHQSKIYAVKECNITSSRWKRNLIEFMLNMEEEKMPKFDVILGNPPYKKNFHLEILSKLSKKCDILTFIQPSNPFLDQRKKNIYKKHLEKIDLPLSSIEIVNSSTSFPDAKIQSLVCITYFDKNHITSSVDYSNEITGINKKTMSPDVFTGLRGYKQLHDMFFNLELSKSLKSIKLKKSDVEKTNYFYVGLPKLRGNVGDKNKFFKDDFFTYYSKSKIKVMSAGDKCLSRTYNFEFKSKNEAENFVSYLDTRFAKAMLLIKKRDFHPKFCSTPIVDWNVKWTDQMLFSKYNLTQDTIDFILNNKFVV